MNIWNIALLARVFVFFAYPLTISGDQCWISGFEKISGGAHATYGWWHTGFFNSIFEFFGLDTFNAETTVINGFSGATPLALAYEGGWAKVTSVFSQDQMIWGVIPGSVGETNKVFIVIGSHIVINKSGELAYHGRNGDRAHWYYLDPQCVGFHIIYASDLDTVYDDGFLFVCNGIYGY